MSTDDHFSHVLAMVRHSAGLAASIAKSEIKAMAETHRRSVGQRNRWIKLRLLAMTGSL